MNDHGNELYSTVIRNDYCVGCGVCAVPIGSSYDMYLNEKGQFTAGMADSDRGTSETDISKICPLADKSRNEDVLGAELYQHIAGMKHDDFCGYYLKTMAGYVVEGTYREKGGSGGMGTWVAAELMNKRLVDAIIHVGPSERADNTLFSYRISNNTEELAWGAKSKYYPVEMSEVLRYVKNHPARYVLVGVPCFIKAVRLLAGTDERIQSSICYTIGLVCGHLKTDMFAKAIAWEMGIAPEGLHAIDFRVKLEDRAASAYGIEATGLVDGEVVTMRAPKERLYSTDWGYGFFKYKGCDFCDDVLAETADITIGDAWLPKYTGDSMGTNLIIVRNPKIRELLDAAGDRVCLEDLTLEEVFQTQAGGFRHRREGLAFRLYLADKHSQWRPKKRIQPSSHINSTRKKIYIKRTILREESITAFQAAQTQQSFGVFRERMTPHVQEYKKLLVPSLRARLLGKLKKQFL